MKKRKYGSIQLIYDDIRQFQHMIQREDISTHAAGAAFFLFLSIIPMIMIISSLLPYHAILQEDVVTLSQAVIPEKIYRFLVGIAQYYNKDSITLVSISAVVVIWSASKGVLSMIRGLNHVYQIEESRGYVKLRAKAMVYTMLLLFAIMVSISLIVFGNTAMQLFQSQKGLLSWLALLLNPIRHIVVACLISVVFCSMYCLLPNYQLPWKEHFPGAVFTAVFWTLYSLLFSIYIDYMDGFSMYGSLTTVVIVMIWLYFCMYIFFCGAMVNRYLKKISCTK